jgi:hypothetical protein
MNNCFLYISLVFLLPILGLIIFFFVRKFKKDNFIDEEIDELIEKDIVHFDGNYSFITEKPIDGKDEKNPYEFGHREIIETLYKMIGAVVKGSSLTIGLFGDWGSGKSSIAKGLELKLLDKKIPTVLFDVWKHEGDSLRRTFLKFLVNELKKKHNGKRYLKKRYSFTHNFDSSVKKFKLTFPTWKEIGNLLLSYTLLFAGVVFLIWIVADVILKEVKFELTDIPKLIVGVITTFPLTFIVKLGLKSTEGFLGKKIEIIDEKFIDPIQFEEEFKLILLELKKVTDKLVIIFDNLDRVSGEKSLELISTIKTFLEPADKEIDGIDVIFLLPCDELAIERHLSIVNSSTDTSKRDRASYSREYLRKFFNTILRIPKFDLSELVDFTNNQLKKTNVPEFSKKELASLIASQFRSNPRQIIQFINILLSKFILFKERELSKEGGLNKGFTTKNTLQLAKYLMVEQRFSEILLIYSELQERNINNDTSVKNKYLAEENKTELTIRESDFFEFEMFLSNTKHIFIHDLDIFTNTRESKFHANFPNSSNIITILEENLTKNVMNEELKDEKFIQFRDYLNSIDWDKYIDDFDSLVVELLDKKKTNEPELCRIINSVLNFFEHYNKVTISDSLIASILGYLDHDNYLVSINYINEPSLLFKHLFRDEKKNKELQRKIIKQWSLMIKSKNKDES